MIVLLCAECNRGHIYCSKECAVAARRQSVREAGRRYRRKPHVRMANKIRLEKWRAKRDAAAANETHHPSEKPGATPSSSATGAKRASASETQHVRPHQNPHQCFKCRKVIELFTLPR
jgi:hypothetical protein